jgi:hypothetical protein
MTNTIEVAAPIGRDRRQLVGRVMSALVIAFLLLDATMKLLALPNVLEAGTQIGFPGVGMAHGLGALLLICTVLYIAPRTSVLGAILLTGYLGGAVATHVRLGNPLFTHIAFGVYVGVLMWGGLWLRNAALRALIPVSSKG